jgi:hypothetical protein
VFAVILSLFSHLFVKSLSTKSYYFPAILTLLGVVDDCAMRGSSSCSECLLAIDERLAELLSEEVVCRHLLLLNNYINIVY